MLTLIGIILIAVGSFNIFQYNKAVEGSSYTIGTLVRYNYSPNLNKYYPVFRYVVEGITYEEEYQHLLIADLLQEEVVEDLVEVLQVVEEAVVEVELSNLCLH